MELRNLVPWGRSNDVPTARSDEPSPFLALHRQMNRLFDDFFRDFDLPLSGQAGRQASWPQVEVVESDRAYTVSAELPGLDEKDIEITLRDGVLTLKGEKKTETNGGDNGRYSERWYGRFERAFALGSEVDPDKVNAAFKNGVLTVTIAKRPDAQSRVKRIPVVHG